MSGATTKLRLAASINDNHSPFVISLSVEFEIKCAIFKIHIHFVSQAEYKDLGQMRTFPQLITNRSGRQIQTMPIAHSILLLEFLTESRNVALVLSQHTN
ncbi:hypothetical protein VNO77_20129 [Canavalia gladiata]|uniref:Uncharacterized protein n=1 Tax=Canavalia gladiata TaxID=3824 RepID=A0AAN9LS86_CANGL